MGFGSNQQRRKPVVRLRAVVGVHKASESAAAPAFASSSSEVNPAPKFHWETLRHRCFYRKKTSETHGNKAMTVLEGDQTSSIIPSATQDSTAEPQRTQLKEVFTRALTTEKWEVPFCCHTQPMAG
nr:uncharacterized protein LOC101143918 [Gorilla gorilla gorilla]